MNENNIILYVKNKEYILKRDQFLNVKNIINLFEAKIKFTKNKDNIVFDDLKIVVSDTENILKLHSDKKNKDVFIDVSYFVDFLNRNKITKLSNSLDDILLDSHIIVHRDGSFYVENDFLNKFISPYSYQNDLVLGNSYLLDDKEVIYLGYRYVSTLFINKYIRFDRISNIVKKQYILIDNVVEELNTKLISKDNLQKLSQKKCDELLHNFYLNHFEITYFNKSNIEDEVNYGFVKCNDCLESPFIKIGEAFYTKVQNSNNINTSSKFNRNEIFKENSFEFKLLLNGKSFNSVEAEPIVGKNSFSLQRIGLLLYN